MILAEEDKRLHLYGLTTTKFKRESPKVFLIARNFASNALQGPPYV